MLPPCILPGTVVLFVRVLGLLLLYYYFYYCNNATISTILLVLQGGCRRDGLTPALAQRMPVVTETVGKSRP